MNILDACNDPNLFKPWFRKPETWAAWRVFLKSLFAIPGLMMPDEFAAYNACTGRTDLPTEPAQEAWLIVGRRGGKSFVMALLAVFLACFRDYRPYLQPGERAAVLVIAADRKQARTIMRYVRGLLTRIPMLKRMIEREATESFELTNSTVIEVATASFRAVRGYTVCAVLGDEVAFWRSEDSANPDHEILNAVRPAMATIPNALLICASSPYAKRGALWDAHRRYYGQPGPILVWKAPTRTMNPSVRQRLIDEATERDPAAAAAEYGAEFRSDIAAFVDREIVLSCVEASTHERPNHGHAYVAFCDPSGGSSDSMTLAIAHADRHGQIILDLLREVTAPFVPGNVVDEFVKTLHAYGIKRVVGDRYAGEWVRQSFEAKSIRYDHSELPKSDLYRDLLPHLNSNSITLLDNSKLVNQLAGLERKSSRGGKDSIDHSPGAKDDVANACAGVASLLAINNTAKLWARARDPELAATWHS